MARMDVSEQVAKYKVERGIPVLNEERERQILDDVAGKCGDRGETIKTVFAATMDASRALQHKMMDGGADLRKEIPISPKATAASTTGTARGTIQGSWRP